MKGFNRFGLVLGVLAAAALLGTASARVRAADEQVQPTAKVKPSREESVKRFKVGPQVRRIERTFEHTDGAFLGVGVADVGKADLAALKLGEERGAVVRSITADSAAAKAGLKEGDVILRYQGETVWSAAQFRRLIRETPAGRTISLDVTNAGAARTVAATLGERSMETAGFGPLEDFDIDLPGMIAGEMPEPPEPPEALEPPDAPDAPEAPNAPRPPHAPRPPRIMADRVFRFKMPDGGGNMMWRGGMFAGEPRKLGLEFQPVSGQLANYFKLAGEGILVTNVAANGPAAVGGVRAGDIIMKVNGKAVADGGALREAMESVQPGQEVSLTLQRDGSPVEVKLKAGGNATERAITT
jgi:serine protease Do